MSSYRILIVDDSMFSRMNLRSILEANGHKVVGEAPDGVEAVNVYKATKPDLVTMDLNMPQASGVEAIRNISAVDPNARFIIVSAVDQRLVWDECASMGVCEYVSKPVQWPKLKSAIAHLMSAGTGKEKEKEKGGK